MLNLGLDLDLGLDPVTLLTSLQARMKPKTLE